MAWGVGGLVVLAMALGVLVSFVHSWQAFRWPTVPGELIESSISDSVDGTSVFLHVRYSYEVNGGHPGSTAPVAA